MEVINSFQSLPGYSIPSLTITRLHPIVQDMKAVYHSSAVLGSLVFKCLVKSDLSIQKGYPRLELTHSTFTWLTMELQSETTRVAVLKWTTCLSPLNSLEECTVTDCMAVDQRALCGLAFLGG